MAQKFGNTWCGQEWLRSLDNIDYSNRIVYMISREIDNNPFLVFEMHNVYLFEELRRRGIRIEQSEVLDVNDFESLLQERMDKTICEHQDKMVNLSRLEDITEPMIKILPINPSFADVINFRDKYSSGLMYVIKKMQKVLKKDDMFESLLSRENNIKIAKGMVESFQTDKMKQVFILSLKAAVTGLNLTAATHVIHFDLWWNPAVEAQT